MRVSVVGTGYVGLVSGVCLAEKGHEVTCVDVDGAKVERINKGIPPIFEEGLEQLLKKNLGAGFRATTDLKEAIAESEITLIAVGTPFDGKKIDLASVKRVALEIGACLKDKAVYHTVVVKSTVVPGTTDTVVRQLLEQASGKRAGVDFGLGMNPEFLTEGQAIQDFMHPDRIVIGGIDERSIAVMVELYTSFRGTDLLCTNPRTAEMIKYASNAMLATQISFANEIANLCSALGGIDAVDVMRGVHLSNYLRPFDKNGQRVQAPLSSFLDAGCGFGGSCLPKDVKALIAQAQGLSSPMSLLEAVVRINDQQPMRILLLLRRHFPQLQGVRVGILGLAFKPDTDDMRESPAIPIVRELLSQGAIIKAYDPVAMDEAKRIFDDERIVYCRVLEDCLTNVDTIVLLTRWDEFKVVPSLLKASEQPPMVIDGRRFLDKQLLTQYDGIGL